MNVWQLLLVFEIALAAVVLLFVFVGWCRKRRMVTKAHSPEHRLRIPNLWTEGQQVKNGASTQMMRMRDGHFILLSVGPEATKVLVSPQSDSVESFTELASFPMRKSHGSCRQQAAILNDLKRHIGFPESVGDLRDRLQGISPPDHLSDD